MKFKITVIGLLTIILIICTYTAYNLINATKKQTEILMIIGNSVTERDYYEIGSIDKESYQSYVWDRGEKFAEIMYGEE